VLWMNNCKLEDLDGISSISQLQVSRECDVVNYHVLAMSTICVFCVGKMY